jgi:predicted HNH restriction endonuclease
MWRRHARKVRWEIAHPVAVPQSLFPIATVSRLSSQSIQQIIAAYSGRYPQLTDRLGELFGTYSETHESTTIQPTVETESTSTEGAIQQTLTNRYERNPQARQECIEHYGPSCIICSFNFGRRYGPAVEGLIHVHHLRPLSEIGTEHRVNPIEDLRPVCPNCHAVIHSQDPPYGLHEVGEMLR